MPTWDDPARTAALKKEATAQLEAGVQEFTLNVDLMGLRERHKVRLHVNRWLRKHGWLGSVHYDSGTETLAVRVVRRRDDSTP